MLGWLYDFDRFLPEWSEEALHDREQWTVYKDTFTQWWDI